MPEKKSWSDREESDYIEEEPEIYASSLAGYMVASTAFNKTQEEVAEEM